jgi:hypothetical protein
MGQDCHGSAKTTHAVRAAIQQSQASLATLSRELGINPKTVAKWRKRATVEDRSTARQQQLHDARSAQRHRLPAAGIRRLFGFTALVLRLIMYKNSLSLESPAIVGTRIPPYPG